MPSQAEVQRVQQVLDNDPQVQAAFKQVEEMRRQGIPIVNRAGQPSLLKWAVDNLQPLMQRALDAQGLQMPHDWSVSLGEDGSRVGELNRKGWWDRNVDWVAPAIVGGAGVVGGLGAAGAFGGGGSGAAASAGAGAGAGTGAGVGTGAGAGTLASTPAAFTGAGFAPTATSALGGGSMAGGGIWSSLLSNPETWSTAASLLGGIGAGAGQERQNENANQRDTDRLLASIFGAQQTAATRATEDEEAGKLNRAELGSRNAQAEEDAKRYRAQLGISAPAERTRQSVYGSVLQNIQPVSVNVPDRVRGSLVEYEGGLSPALINDLARESGAELQRQAHEALLNRSDIPSMTELPKIPEPTNFQASLLTPPDVQPYQRPGGFESATSAGATAASIGGIVAALLKNRNRGGQTTPPAVGA